MGSDKIKILYIALDMDLGGLQRVVNLLIRRIDKELFIPYLCCLDRGGIFCEELKENEVGTYILNRKPGPFDTGLFKNLCKILVDNEIDIIHSQNGCSLYSALAGWKAGVKGIVHTDHGRLVPDKRSAVLEDRFSSWMMDCVVGVSENLTEYLETGVKINKKKLLTIINGVDTDRFVPLDTEQRNKLRDAIGLNRGDKVLGTICRLDPIKNLEFLIRSLPSLSEAIPGCKLLIVGDGPSEESLRSYAKSNGVASKVMFMGRSAEVEKMLPVFDLYVCSSLSEGTSMTILEAMACGLPIVASAVGGNGKLIDHSNGLLFPLNDEKAFHQGTLSLLKDPERLKRMGECSRARVEADFNLDRFVGRYEELYQSVYAAANAN